ncbi:11402_t:CDS:2, partial [Cetraspora pellucida]
QLGISIEEESKTVVVTATGARECILESIAKFQKARAIVDFDEQKLVIRYLDRRFEVPIMHTGKKKQKEYVNKDVRSGNHNGDKNNDDDLFEGFEYESEDLEEVESYFIDSISVDEVLKKEVPTEKKVSLDGKPPVEDQL